jgi:hypothetical protein
MAPALLTPDAGAVTTGSARIANGVIGIYCNCNKDNVLLARRHPRREPVVAGAADGRRLIGGVYGGAVGLLALLRNEGGSVGTSVAQTIQERREQFHVLRLNEKLDSLYPAVHQWLAQGQDFFLRRTGDPVRAQQMTLRGLQELRDRQAAALAYFDVFWSLAVVAALMVFRVLLMRRSVAEKGAHVGAE